MSRWLAAVVAAVAAMAACARPEAPGAAAPDGGDLAVVATPIAEGPVEPEPGRPVLLITVDTLRWDALGSYGASTPTPALDALAAAGTRFEHAVAHAVVTLPSHASILTGTDPSRHGVHDNDGFRLADVETTWAERLQAAGYATGAFVGAFPVDSLFGLAQGFDRYDDAYGAGSGGGLRLEERRATVVVESALDWIAEVAPQDATGGAEPWFAWVHVYDPHAPYAAPEPWSAAHADDPYAGEVAYVDTALAPLLQAARLRDAIVVVTSDHGEALGEHGEETHGVFAYASTLRVPLIIAGLRGAPPGQIVHARVRHIDLLPTILEALGLDHADVQGGSLSPVMRGQPPTDDRSYFEALTPSFDWGWAPLRGLYAGRLKYIDLPIPELYDVHADPGETADLIDTAGTDLVRMDGLLAEHLAAATAVAPTTIEDSATLRRLRALGYVAGAEATATDRAYGPEDDPKRLIVLEGKLQDAVRAFDAGRYLDAAAELSEVLRRRPDMARAHTLLAAVRDRQSGPLAAVGVLEAARQQGVVTPFLLGRLGFFNHRAGRLREAAEAVEAALVSRPRDVEMLSLLAAIYGDGGRFAEAEALLVEALDLDPTYGRLHANRGTLALQQGDLPAAETSFRRALALDATLAEAHNGLGVVAFQLHDDRTAAVEHWRSALRYDPRQPFVLFNLGRTLEGLGRRQEAIDALERYLQLVPGDADARAAVARLRGGGGGR